jgi:hypothetical protein
MATMREGAFFFRGSVFQGAEKTTFQHRKPNEHSRMRAVRRSKQPWREPGQSQTRRGSSDAQPTSGYRHAFVMPKECSLAFTLEPNAVKLMKAVKIVEPSVSTSITPNRFIGCRAEVRQDKLHRFLHPGLLRTD